MPKNADSGAHAFQSDQPTLELIRRAKGGDESAVNALLERCMPLMRRWAHGRLPLAARGYMDTNDIVQEVAVNAIRKLDIFEPRHIGAMQAYLHQGVINRIRDEVRRLRRRGVSIEVDESVQSTEQSPIDFAMEQESYARYRDALGALSPRERQLVIARVELGWAYAEIAARLGCPSTDAARMATSRAIDELRAEMRPEIQA